jgi:hypothetical protein
MNAIADIKKTSIRNTCGSAWWESSNATLTANMNIKNNEKQKRKAAG